MNDEVWAILESKAEKLTDSSREVCGVAQELAAQLGALPAAVMLGTANEHSAEDVGAMGLERVYQLELLSPEDCCSESVIPAMNYLLRDQTPCLVLFSNGVLGGEVAPYLAACQGRAIAVNAVGFEVESGSSLVLHQLAYGGRAHVRVRLQGPAPFFVTCQEHAFGIPAVRHKRRAETITVQLQLPVGRPRVRRRRILSGAPRTIDIGEADLVVAGGLGFRSKDDLESLWRVADLLGASLGATRPLVDQGWIESERQIGATGRTVSPKLYLAFGISGATQHISGVVNPGAVVAVNKDAGAPILKMADLGLVGDLYEILPQVIRELEEARGRKGE